MVDTTAMKTSFALFSGGGKIQILPWTTLAQPSSQGFLESCWEIRVTATPCLRLVSG
jgi:hypothetical protein